MVELGHALVEVTEHGVELVEEDRRDACVEGGDEGLVVDVEPMDDVGDDLIILDGLPRSGKLVGEATERGEVGGWLPFCALMSTVLILFTRLMDCDENIPANMVQSACVVVTVLTVMSTSLERVPSKQPNTC